MAFPLHASLHLGIPGWPSMLDFWPSFIFWRPFFSCLRMLDNGAALKSPSKVIISMGLHVTFEIGFLLFDNPWYWVAISGGVVEYLSLHRHKHSPLPFHSGILMALFGECLRGWSIFVAGVQFSHEIRDILEIDTTDPVHRRLVTCGPYR